MVCERWYVRGPAREGEAPFNEGQRGKSGVSGPIQSPYLDPVLWRLVARRRVDSVDAAFVAGSLRAALLEALPADASGGMARPDEVGGQVAVLAVSHGDTLESVGLALPRSLRRDERSRSTQR